MTTNKTNLVTTKKQYSLFHVEKHAEINGIEMGVLENGIPYLTQRGLARMCGIDNAALIKLASNWDQERIKPRGAKIDALLQEGGYEEDSLFLKSELNGRQIHAYTEPVCMALLEYYAFVAPQPKREALNAYRVLAKRSFRTFIYSAVGYSPNQKFLDSWTHFHDRVDMTENKVPTGYFGVFPEIAGIIVPMIKAGVIINERIIPDISVGRAWSIFWKKNGLENKYGTTTTYAHEYPDYYPQAESNPQSAKAYPEAALGDFRAWLREHYIINNFPKYLRNQAKAKKLSRSEAELAIESFAPKAVGM